MDKKALEIGIISDTHGLIRPKALEALRNVDYILHAGDIGSMRVLDSLRAIAPVTAVRGNVDDLDCAGGLPQSAAAELQGRRFFIIHNVRELDLDPRAAGFAAVISGHTHQSSIKWVDEVLYFNPGAAGPRRFQLPVSVGILHILDGTVSADVIEL